MQRGGSPVLLSAPELQMFTALWLQLRFPRLSAASVCVRTPPSPEGAGCCCFLRGL